MMFLLPLFFLYMPDILFSVSSFFSFYAVMRFWTKTRYYRQIQAAIICALGSVVLSHIIVMIFWGKDQVGVGAFTPFLTLTDPKYFAIATYFFIGIVLQIVFWKLWFRKFPKAALFPFVIASILSAVFSYLFAVILVVPLAFIALAFSGL